MLPGTAPASALMDGADLHTGLWWVGGESNLDFQLTYPLIYPQTTTLFQTDDINYAQISGPGTGFANTFLDTLGGVSRSSQTEIHEADLQASVVLHILSFRGERE